VRGKLGAINLGEKKANVKRKAKLNLQKRKWYAYVLARENTRVSMWRRQLFLPTTSTSIFPRVFRPIRPPRRRAVRTATHAPL
jgi:hypothetical protein